MNDFEFHRRDLLKLIGSAVRANLVYGRYGESLIGTFTVPADYRPRFLKPAEYELTVELCEIIIPSDEDSPGAKQAGVPWFIDTVLLYAGAEQQERWRSGLAGIDALASELKGNTFLRCSVAERLQVAEHLSGNEDSAGNAEETFFGELKAIAMEAFCLSDVGMKQYLHYRGNTVMSEFAGCPNDSVSSS